MEVQLMLIVVVHLKFYYGGTNQRRIMNFNVWSCHLWICIHFMALQVELDQKACNINNERLETTITFFEGLHHLMTCEHCRISYEDFLKHHPPCHHRTSLFEWTINLHNHVNEKLGKPPWNLHEAFTYYIDRLPK